MWLGIEVRACLAAILIPWLLLAAPGSFASKRARFATHDEVAQVWVGLTSDGRSLLRLVLAPDGTGWGGQAFLSGQLEVFRIATWRYGRGKISATTQRNDSGNVETQTLEGSVDGWEMELTLRGQGWKREAALRREADLEGPWHKLKATMAELSQTSP